MSNRLSQIATRTGDDGTTGLGDGTRVPKSHLRIAAMGDVDELNSHIGVLLAEPLPGDVRELLVTIQHELFNLGGELSIPGYTLLKDGAVAGLDDALARYNATLPRLAEFILPAGTRSASLAHVARAVAKRAAPFGLRMMAFDPFIQETLMYDHGVMPATLSEVLSQSVAEQPPWRRTRSHWAPIRWPIRPTRCRSAARARSAASRTSRPARPRATPPRTAS